MRASGMAGFPPAQESRWCIQDDDTISKLKPAGSGLGLSRSHLGFGSRVRHVTVFMKWCTKGGFLITHAGTIDIDVSDQQLALDFYTKQPGFHVFHDEPSRPATPGVAARCTWILENFFFVSRPQEASRVLTYGSSREIEKYYGVHRPAKRTAERPAE